jgi:ATP-dependent exoDNAse (exonuclease V) alpha subunit
LVHVDTERAGEKLINRRLAYVAVSRGRYDAQVYTNDKSQLAEGLSRDVSHRPAIESSHATESPAEQKMESSTALSHAAEQAMEQGLSMGR